MPATFALLCAKSRSTRCDFDRQPAGRGADLSDGARTMRNMRLMISAGLYVLLSGCVIGSGPCLWLQVRHDFTGHVHFREFPRSDGVDMVPILVLDKTQYMYAPPQSFHCLAANDV